MNKPRPDHAALYEEAEAMLQNDVLIWLAEEPELLRKAFRQWQDRHAPEGTFRCVVGKDRLFVIRVR